jgi:hypothetical protein
MFVSRVMLLLALTGTFSGCGKAQKLLRVWLEDDYEPRPPVNMPVVRRESTTEATDVLPSNGQSTGRFQGLDEIVAKPDTAKPFSRLMNLMKQIEESGQRLAATTVETGSESLPSVSPAETAVVLKPLSPRDLEMLDEAVTALETRFAELQKELGSVKQQQIAERKAVEERFGELKSMIQALEGRLLQTEAKPQITPAPAPVVGSAPVHYQLKPVQFPCGAIQDWWVPLGRSFVTCPRCKTVCEFELK